MASRSATLDPQAHRALQQATTALLELDTETAQQQLDSIETSSPEALAAADRLRAELAVIGAPAHPFDGVRWLQGTPDDLDLNQPLLLVFWEPWCAFCRDALPRVEALWQAWRDQGLQVIALTRLTGERTGRDALVVVERHRISFPVGVEPNAALGDHYAVTGVPAAVLLHDGAVLWRGHPTLVNDHLLQRVFSR